MATLILRPNAAGDSTLWTPNTGANYAAVDEVVNDGDTTYVSNPSTSSKDDLYNIGTDALLDGATISQIELFVSAKNVLSGTSGSTPSDPTLYRLVKTGGTVYAGAGATIGSAYADGSYVWATNPNTSAAWTKSDIDDLQVGIRSAQTAGGGNKLKTPYATQVWVVVTYTTAPAPVTLTDVGNIASAFAAGVASIALAAALTGIAGAEAFGSPAIGINQAASSIVSAEAFGAGAISTGLNISGIATAEAIGEPVLEEGIAPVELTDVGDIASAEAHGTQSIGLGLGASGIATEEAFGVGAILADIAAGGIVSAEAIGTPLATPGLSASGIATAEAVGTPAISLVLPATGIATGEAIGTPATGQGLAVSGIVLAELFGTPDVEEGAVPTEITDAGAIASAEALGTGSIAPSLGNTGIASNETIGDSQADIVASPVGIPGAEAFGTPIAAEPPPPVELTNVGAIASAEGLGTPVVTEGPAEAEIAINLISPLVTSISIETNTIESIDVASGIITEINTTSEVF